MSLNENYKKEVLRNINSFSDQELDKLLDQGITIKDMIKKGLLEEKLNGISPSRLNDLIKSEEITIYQLIAAGLNGVAINAIDFSLIKSDFDNKKVTIEELESANLSSEKVNQLNENTNVAPQPKNPILIYEEINKNKKSPEEIRVALLEGRITKENLLKYTRLDESLIERIETFEPFESEYFNVEDLPAIEKNRTDLYFFGIAGTGKSCILASLLSYINRKGMMENNMGNPHGNRYMGQLINCFSRGILPYSTQLDYVNYVPFGLRNSNELNKIHPMNLIELSGERLSALAEEGKEAVANLKNFLSNNNRKVFTFIVDYFQATDSKLVSSTGSFAQNIKLQNILTLMKDFGLMEKVDVIYIVVSKADLFPENVHPIKYSVEYLEKYYMNFINECRVMKKKHNFKIYAMPFSIGPTICQNLLVDANPSTNDNLDKYPQLLSEQLLVDTFKKS